MVTESNLPEPETPDRGTEALADYTWAMSCDQRLFNLVIDSVLTGDYVAHVARRALDDNPVSSGGPAGLARSKPGPRTKALRRSRQELLEMFLSRAVDNFQAYLVDMIRRVLSARPEILSDRRQELSLGYILRFGSIDALVTDMIEGKVASLSYEGFGELQEWCEARGIPLLVPDGEREAVIGLIAHRNIIIHNRGKVDPRYRRANPMDATPVGQQKTLHVDDYFDALSLLGRVVNLTDAGVAEKFRLNCIDVKEETRLRSDTRFASGRDAPPSAVTATDAEAVESPESIGESEG